MKVLDRVQSWLFFTYAAALCLNLFALFFVFAPGGIDQNELIQGITVLVAVYGAPLGVIGAGVFVTPRAEVGLNPLIVRVALTLCVMWNGIMVARSVLFALALAGSGRTDNIEDLVSFWQEAAAFGSVLCTASLAYMFGASSVKK